MWKESALAPGRTEEVEIENSTSEETRHTAQRHAARRRFTSGHHRQREHQELPKDSDQEAEEQGRKDERDWKTDGTVLRKGRLVAPEKKPKTS